ncbi:MAG: PilN domain-containing protein [Clostridia bacterium]
MNGVDLLPKGLPERPKTSVSRIAVTASLLGFVLAAVLLYVGKAQEIADLRRALTTREEDYARYAWLDSDIAKTRKSADELLAKLAAAERQIGGGLPAKELLEDLPRLLPRGVRLLQFTLESDGRAVIHGEAVSLQAVASLILALEDAGLFEAVRLTRTDRTGEGSGPFAFQAQATLLGVGGETP